MVAVPEAEVVVGQRLAPVPGQGQGHPTTRTQHGLGYTQRLPLQQHLSSGKQPT